jgi:hypothetical protein
MNDKSLIPKDESLPAAPVVNNAVTMLQAIGQMALNPDVEIEKVERLFALQKELQDRENEAAFNDALSKAQAGMHVVTKNKWNDQTSSHYADLGAIVAAITPIYTAQGINLSFDSGKAVDGMIPITCYVSACGHTREYHYDSPITDKGIKGTVMMTPAHARGSAISYGRRYLTCMIFNIATSDDDGNGGKGSNDGQQQNLITPDQVNEIKALLLEKKKDKASFLNYYNEHAKTNIDKISMIDAGWYTWCIKRFQGGKRINDHS